MRGRATGLGARMSSTVGLLIFSFIQHAVVEERGVMFRDLRFDERDFVLGQAVAPVELRIGPHLIERQFWHEAINAPRSVLGWLAERHKEPREAGPQTTGQAQRLCF